MSRVKEFRAFLCMGRYKSLGILKSFLWYASQLSGMRCVFTSWASPGGVAAVWWLLDSRYSPSWVPLGLTSSHLRAVVTGDCDILIYWCGRKYSISHSHQEFKEQNENSLSMSVYSSVFLWNRKNSSNHLTHSATGRNVIFVFLTQWLAYNMVKLRMSSTHQL